MVKFLKEYNPSNFSVCGYEGLCSYKYDSVLDGVKVRTQESMKISGVILDKMLYFKDHILK